MAARGRRSRSFERYLGADEVTVLVTRQHPFSLLGRVGQMLGLLAPLLLAAWGVAGVESLQNVVGAWLLRLAFVVMVLLVARLAWHVLAWEFERVVVTDEKVIHLEGVLKRRIASTPLAKVSEFTVSQPLLGRVFDFGSLVVDVPGGREQALHGLAYLPDPAGLYRLVSDTARRGRVHEGGGRNAPRADVPPPPPPPTPAPESPWAPALRGDDADHTIRIARVEGDRP